MDTNTVLYYITYFIVYSFLGWVIESVYKSIYEKKFVNSGFMMGPFCPIYGFGALIMLLCLSFLKNMPILLFITAFVILSIWEYLVGLYLEKVFKTKYWDYSHYKYNIHGRICLRNSIFWGILGLLFIELVHPFIDSYIKLIPINLLIYVNVIIGIAMIVDFIQSANTIVNFESMVTKINEIGITIKEKVKDLNIKNRTKAQNNIENVEKIIQDLRRREAKLRLRIYKHASRLKNAFPSMKSESITSFLNQKIDIRKLKESTKKKRE